MGTSDMDSVPPARQRQSRHGVTKTAPRTCDTHVRLARCDEADARADGLVGGNAGLGDRVRWHLVRPTRAQNSLVVKHA